MVPDVTYSDTEGGRARRARPLAYRARFLAADAALLAIALAAAYALRFNFAVPENHLALLPYVFPFTLAVELAFLWAFGCFRTVWRYFSALDLPGLLRAAGSASLVFLVCRVAFSGVSPRFYPPISVNLANAVISVALLAGARWLCRVLAEQGRRGGGLRRVVVADAGSLGGAAAYALRHEVPPTREVVGFLDDSDGLAGATVQGLPILGALRDAARILRERRADEVIVPAGRLSREAMQGLFAAAREAGARLLVAPGYSAVLDAAGGGRRLRDADITDLLRRGDIPEETLAAHRAFLAGRRVMVTGAGGSIGSEIARQALKAGVASLTLVDRGELALFTIGRELAGLPGAGAVRRFVADVADEARMRRLIASERPEVVFHAAAYKHVPLMEENVCEAIRNNVLGTVRLARLCAAGGVRSFVLLSSDKAVAPTSAMGATKRACELALQCLNGGSTSFCAVRFGNVLGSTGSVVPIFREQIENGGPVTVTHPDMSRYFMTIPEAVSLTLLASAMGDSGKGKIFVLDMGEPVRIVDLAEKMIRLAGKTPGRDIPIVFVGPRPGEKLSEQLVADGERLEPTDHPQIGSCVLPPVDQAALDDFLHSLDGVLAAGDDAQARDLLMAFASGRRRP